MFQWMICLHQLTLFILAVNKKVLLPIQSERQRRADTIAKILILTFNDDEEKAIERVLSALSDEIGLEPMQPVTSPVLSFPNLEIKLYQRRVLRDGEDVSLTRLEYGALCYLAASPGRVFTKEQIFEAVWSMESESCQSSVTNVIYSLRKKIEPDSKKPTYIKTVLGMGYKFASGNDNQITAAKNGNTKQEIKKKEKVSCFFAPIFVKSFFITHQKKQNDCHKKSTLLSQNTFL